MQICQNRPLDEFMQYSFMCSSALCIVTWHNKSLCSTNLCDLCLTHIIRININLVLKLVALRYYCWRLAIFLLIQRREQRLQDQLSNPHYLKPSSAASSKASGGGGRAGESTGLTESSGLTAIDTSKIPVQKLELGIGLIIGKSYMYMYMYVQCRICVLYYMYVHVHVYAV